MAIATQQDLALGQHAPDFHLEATDGKRYRLADMSGGIIRITYDRQAAKSG